MVHPLKVILNSDRNKVKISKVDRKPVERTFDVFFSNFSREQDV